MLRHPLVKVLLVLVGLGVLFQVVIGLSPERFSMRDQPAEMAVAARGDEALIFVPSLRMGRRTNVLAEKLGGWLPALLRMGVDSPSWLPAASPAFHFRNGKLDRFELKNIGSYCRYAPVEGTPAVASRNHYSEGAEGYRWDGARFVPLAGGDASSVAGLEVSGAADPIAVLREEQQAFAQAGWKFDRMPLAGAKERELKFDLAGRKHTLLFAGTVQPVQDFAEALDWARPAGPFSVTLRGPEGKDETLVSGTGEWSRLTEDEFFAGIPEEYRDMMRSQRPMLMGPLGFLWSIFSSLFFLVPWLPFLLPLWWMLGYRSRTLKTLPDTYDFQPATPAEFAGLDRARLDELSASLEPLGFQPVKDFSVVPDVGKFEPDFSRLYMHPAHHCFAQVVQFFPHRGKPRPMTVVLHSLLENDWSVSTAPEHTAALTYRARLPQSLWFCVPGVSPAQLLEAHLARREQVCHDAGTRVYAGLNFAAYQSYVLGRYAERRQALRKQGILFGPREAFVLRFRPPLEWRGALATRRTT